METIGEPARQAPRERAWAKASLPPGPNDWSASDLRRLLLLLAGFIVVWTLATLLSRWSGPIFDDLAEAWSWGREQQLGYYKHPPLFGWVARIWFALLPRTDWSGYLLGAATSGLGLVGVWHLAGSLVADRRTQLTAVLMLAVTPFVTWMATRFNANAILLPIWPWAAFFLVRSLKSRSPLDGTAFGLLAGAAMLSKYQSIVFLVSCLAAALLHPDRRAYWRSPSPYVAIAVAAAVMAPHLRWAIENDFPTLAYALAKTGNPWRVNEWKAFSTGIATLALLLPALAMLLFAVAPDRRGDVLARLAHPLARVPAWLAVLALGPFALTVALGATGRLEIATDFMVPVAFLIPVVLLWAGDVTIDAAGLRRALAASFGYAVLSLLMAPVLAFALFHGLNRYASTPSRETAFAATDLWHRAFATPVRIVTGTERYSLGLVYYCPDRPAEFSHFKRSETPWITPQRIAAEGLLVACLAEDAACHAHARPYMTPATRIAHVTLATRLFGQTAAPHTIDVIMIPPAAR